jgi:dUTP pyrophosphatase
MTLQVKLHANFRYLDNEIPRFTHPGDAGMDLRADLEGPLTLSPGDVIKVPTGLSVELPAGDSYSTWEMQIRSRSGLARQGIVVANSPGTIDSGYRGEIQVLLGNIGNNLFIVEPGARVAQAVVSLCAKFEWEIVDELGDTSRNHQGFGSSGIK